MIYLVNQSTKEHKVAGLPEGINGWTFDGSDDVWRVVQADSDGWIKWDGSDECPLPERAKCHVGDESGWRSTHALSAGGWSWAEVDKYKPTLNDKEQDMTTTAVDDQHAVDTGEWDGEGLPPAGCEVEAFADDEWCRAEWFKQHNGQHAVFFIRSRALGWADDIRPIRTAAQRAEDEAVEAMRQFFRRGTFRDVYRAIREGRIPGVRLDD